jgi:hypothetical protein
LYLFPRNNFVVDCDSVSLNLQAIINCPTSIANGDKDKIGITLTNVGDKVIDGLMVFAFKGTAKIRLEPPTKNNRIEFKSFYPNEKQSVTINFSVDEPFTVVSNPGNYVDFNVCTGNDDFNNFHIAMSPIYGLRNLIKFLWGTVGVAIVGLLWSQIKEWLLSVFKGKNG